MDCGLKRGQQGSAKGPKVGWRVLQASSGPETRLDDKALLQGNTPVRRKGRWPLAHQVGYQHEAQVWPRAEEASEGITGGDRAGLQFPWLARGT